MDSALRSRLHDLTLAARHLLTTEAGELLEGVYGLHRDGRFEPADRLPAIQQLPEAAETRARLERLLADEKTAGLSPREALAKLTKEVAYTWLNRVAAFKMLEARKLIRPSISKGMQSSGFLMWLAEPGNEAELERYEAGSLPLNALGEGPRDTAFRHYLLHLCAQMAGQIRVLFDPDDLPSHLCPRPRALADLLALVNALDVAPAWDDDETIGWIYQYFNEQEKAEVFARLNKGAKITASEIPAATELFTPRWIVRALVENSLGRLWLQMHPDSRLRATLAYLVSDVDAPPIAPKPVCEITLLDPACGTMHFGLVAFDLFAAMYREELERAGAPGWPVQPSVRAEREIAAAIVEHNLFGIDIDLRAVQLSALTLYLKAASLNPKVTIRDHNLACADVLLLNGERLDAFIAEARFSRPIYERVIRAVWAKLREANQLGSLLRLEEQIRALVADERRRYLLEGQGRLPFPELRGLFEEEADEDGYWEILEAQIVQAFDEFARQQARAGHDQTYFAGEAVKGMRLLDVMLRRYDVVAANPPYMTSRNMSPAMNAFLKQDYPASKGDLYAAFIDRCSQMLAPGGRLAMITQQSFMFISSYEDLRAKLRRLTAIETMIHVGPRAFAEIGGEKVNTTLFVLRAEPDAARRDNSVGTYIRLVREPDAEAKRHGFERALAALRAARSPQAAQADFAAEGHPGAVSTAGSSVYRYRQGDFDAIPGAPWVYWITPGLRHLFQTLPKLKELAESHQGLATADNPRFIRWWWEVGKSAVNFGCLSSAEARRSGDRWFPHVKGSDDRKWYTGMQSVLNWQDDGAEIRTLGIEPGRAASRPQNVEFYFRRCLTYTAVSSANFSVRLVPGGAAFDSGGDCLFPYDNTLTVPLLALLNTQVAKHWLDLLNPTVNVGTTDMDRIPVPQIKSLARSGNISRAIALARADSAEDETTYEFIAPPGWPDGMARVAARHAALAAVERAIDEEVYRLYGIGPADRAAIEAELGFTTEETEETEGESFTTEETEGTEGRAEAEGGRVTAEDAEDAEGEREEGEFKSPAGDEGPVAAREQRAPKGAPRGVPPQSPPARPGVSEMVARAGNGEMERGGDTEAERAELARRWVSYAVGIVLGRFEPGVLGALGSGVVIPDAGVYAVSPTPDGRDMSRPYTTEPEGEGPDSSSLSPVSSVSSVVPLSASASSASSAVSPPSASAVPAPEMLAVAEPGIAPEVGAALRALSVPHGIAPVEAGHPSDLAGHVTRALDLLVGEDQTERLVAAATGGRSLAEWLARDFFKEHVKLYHKRPIYWLLQSPRRAYGVYLFSERVTPDTLHLLRGSAYLGGRITRVREDLTGLRGRIAGMPQGAERRREEKRRDALEAELADLEAFDKLIAAVTMRPNSRGETTGWAPELDDGILINLAPLHTLLPAWSAEPKQCWEALERGEYDWSHTAMRYWPDRVLAKCRENKSYAIAHGIALEVEARATHT